MRLSAAIEYIQENYAEDFRIQELAELCHLSETHFRKLFRENMRMAPGEYISRVRIRRACELLLGEDRPVYMVAAQVGYTNLSNFNRAFRRYTGMTPQALKRYPERVELSEFSLNELEVAETEYVRNNRK